MASESVIGSRSREDSMVAYNIKIVLAYLGTTSLR